MEKGKHNEHQERRDKIISGTKLLAAILDTQKIEEQWNRQLILHHNQINQEIYNTTGLNIQSDLQDITVLLENEHFYHKTSKSPERRGVLPGVNANVSSLFVGVAYEVGDMEDLTILQDEIYSKLAKQFTTSINGKLLKAKRISFIKSLFEIGINIRNDVDTQNKQQAQERLEKRESILAAHPFTADLLSENYNPFDLASDYHQQWIDQFGLLYQEKKKEISPSGSDDNWLESQMVIEGLEIGFPQDYQPFDIMARHLASIMAITAWELGPELLPLMKDEIIERIRSYIFDSFNLGHPYFTDKEREIFDKFFTFGFQRRRDQNLPDIGNIPGLENL